ncbi:hypothetical protein [Burkholderia gladioli]|uniref:hypothetical protein n=1 Tax=Burkholderia gladioli TaxID=28095 RepID=UPI00163F3F1A|nr:hypothetical protein [Burkholderia gladioli]
MSESKQQLIDSAFDHLREIGGADAMLVPIPNTTPQLFFAIGEKAQIAKMAGSGATELVEALRNALQLLTDMGAPEEPEDAKVLEAVRAALAKAGA